MMKDRHPDVTLDRPAGPRSRERPPIGLLAVWFGVFAGLAEVGIALVRDNWWVHPDMPLSEAFVWMTPLADVLLFSLVGLLLTAVARWRPRLVSTRHAVFVFAFLAALAVLITFPRLHVVAHILLALGLAVQTARLADKYPGALDTLLRWTTAWARLFRLPRRFQRAAARRSLPGGLQAFLAVTTVLAAIALGMHARERFVEQKTLAGLPAAPAEAPNVLLLVLDTVRAQSLSLYGYDRQTTPNLQRWARRGVRFDRALATAPWTLTTHASLFTGRWPYEMKTGWFTPLDGTHPTLAEALAGQGYATAGFVANLSYCTFKHGLDRGFIRYEDFPVSPGQVVLSASLGRAVGTNSTLRNALGYHELLNRKQAESINADFLGWLSDQEGGRPFFAFLNYFDAHEPYLPPSPFHEAFGPRRPWGAFEHQANGADHAAKYDMSPEDVQMVLDRYDGAIAYLDHHVNRLFEELDRRGVLDNTLVIVTSDHGELFGEHNLFDHGNSLYQSLLHVPLVIHFPKRVPAGVAVSEPVSLRDVPATVLDLVGHDNAHRLPGRSLGRHWTQPDTTASAGTDTLYADTVWDNTNMKTVFIGPYKYIRSKRRQEDPNEEMYNYWDDPGETRDLTDTDEGRRMLDRFRQALTDLLRAE